MWRGMYITCTRRRVLMVTVYTWAIVQHPKHISLSGDIAVPEKQKVMIVLVVTSTMSPLSQWGVEVR